MSPGNPGRLVTAIQLVHEFAADDIATGRKYIGKTIEVSGLVEECRTDHLDRRIIVLKGSHQVTSFENVKCIFPDTSGRPAYSVHAGDHVAVIGQCAGEEFDVMIRNCTLK